MTYFIFGLGYSARAVARALGETPGPVVSVSGTTRSSDRSQVLGLEGAFVHVFDGTTPGETLKPSLGDASHVIVSIPPGADGDPVLACHGEDLMRSTTLGWLCYYSTVGVYGDQDGAWIDETATPDPDNERSRHRLEAENQWRRFAAQKKVPLLILRLAGIYGPGRSGFDRLDAGTARRVVKPGQVFNRIHVADIARVTLLGARHRLSGTFNLADDEPAPPQDVVTHAAELLGVEPPPLEDFETAEMTAMARSFYADNKRVSNAAIKRALGIKLTYPTYRQGLDAILHGLSR